jgi:hypothetical protein
MHPQNIPNIGRTTTLVRPELTVRPELVPATLRLLDQDRMPDDWTIGPERDVMIDRLMDAIQAGERINLAAPRSTSAAEHDGQSPTVAGYLLALIHDRFTLGQLSDWSEFVAMGALAADIEAVQSDA